MAPKRKQNGNGHKLTTEQQRWVCRRLAEWCSTHEIRDELRKEHGVRVSLRAIQKYREKPEWQQVILDFRAQLIARISDLPIASKYWRLKQLQRLFETEDHYRPTRYAKTGEDPETGAGTYEAIEEKPIGELRKMLEHVARELGELTDVTQVQGPGGSIPEFHISFADGRSVHADTDSAAAPAPVPGDGSSVEGEG